LQLFFAFFLNLHDYNFFLIKNLQRDDDLGGGLDRELSEGEYDALNDETFNHAVKDDWEGKKWRVKKSRNELDLF